MKRILFFTFLLLFTRAAFSQEPADSSKAIDDIVVKESYQAEMEEEKLPIDLKFDFSDLIQIPERISWASVKPENRPGILNGWDNFPFKLTDPALANIHPEPVKIFQVNFKNLRDWKLDIFESDGTLFHSISGEDDPPSSIPWDGKNSNGDLIIPGHFYSYSFTAVDHAGNKRTFPGQTFSVSAFFYSDSGEALVRIANDELFSEGGYALSPRASDYIDEIRGLYYVYSRRGEISGYCSHPLATQIFKQLQDELALNENINTSPQPDNADQDCMTIQIE